MISNFIIYVPKAFVKQKRPPKKRTFVQNYEIGIDK